MTKGKEQPKECDAKVESSFIDASKRFYTFSKRRLLSL
jgi:hypothetical protein